MAKKRVTAGAEIKNGNSVKAPTVQNGLAEACGVGGFNAFGLPQIQGFPGTEQLSSPTTIFTNLRWYLVSNFRQVLSEVYVEIGLVQTIVDVPVDDAFRGGIEIESSQLDEDEIKDLQISLDRDDDLNTVAQAAKWNRLFGGAGTLILVEDQDPEEPLDLEAIGKDTKVEFRAVDLWEIFGNTQNKEELMDPRAVSTVFDYHGEKIHKSRIMILKGLTAPSFITPRLRGWGFSVVEILIRSINQYLKSNDLIFEVLDEFKVDVYKFKNLVNTLLQPNGKQKVAERVQIANRTKSYKKGIVLDSEDDWDHKQLSFSGLADAQAGIRMQVASDMRMPLTKLFGISSAGFNSGEDDLEVYNAMVESQVRNKIKSHVLKLCEIKCQVLFGFIPDDLKISFKPLRVLSAEQEENVKTQKFNRLMAAKTAGEITRFEFREACNRGNLLDIQLDNAGDELNPDDPEARDVVELPGQENEEKSDNGKRGDQTE